MSKAKQFYLVLIITFAVLSTLTLAAEVLGFVTLSNTKSLIEETEYRLTKTDEQASILAGIASNYAKAETYIKYVDTALPPQKDASELVSDLDSLATSSGLKLTLIQTNSSNKAKMSAGDLSLLQTTRGKYSYELPLAVEVVGSYNSVIGFVQKLENYQRLVNITTMDISKSGSKDAPADQVDVKFNITAYLK